MYMNMNICIKNKQKFYISQIITDLSTSNKIIDSIYPQVTKIQDLIFFNQEQIFFVVQNVLRLE